jgi:glutamate N-acetyltransferase/amino-acid N-acetyltransferase
MGIQLHVNQFNSNTGHFEMDENGSVTSPKGFTAGGLHCGLKRKRHDLGAIFCEVPASAAAVYTTNQFQAAPLLVTQESLAVEAKLQVMLVNSGNANACTGHQGLIDAYSMRSVMAEQLGIDDHLIGVTSTGVIGELLKMDKVLDGIGRLPAVIGKDELHEFSDAILTTDTFRKNISVTVMVDGQKVTIGGTAKGSGMIHPNMATMLGFITTDANIDSDELQFLLRETTFKTFNMITVDGDTSTNDMVVTLASGLAGNKRLHPGHPDWDAFAEAFQYVSGVLAKKIARDGEGATKLIEVTVEGAESEAGAQAIVKSIIGSNLVKTAVFGADANWGRIIMAIGKAGQPVNVNSVDIRIGDILVLEQSVPQPFDEEKAAAYLKGDIVQIFVDLNMGKDYATGWGCDLTYDYVRINAAYRT